MFIELSGNGNAFSYSRDQCSVVVLRGVIASGPVGVWVFSAWLSCFAGDGVGDTWRCRRCWYCSWLVVLV